MEVRRDENDIVADGQDQAKERIVAAGYADFAGLKLDDKGIWRATATKDGKSVTVALDYQGNIVTE